MRLPLHTINVSRIGFLFGKELAMRQVTEVCLTDEVEVGIEEIENRRGLTLTDSSALPAPWDSSGAGMVENAQQPSTPWQTPEWTQGWTPVGDWCPSSETSDAPNLAP